MPWCVWQTRPCTAPNSLGEIKRYRILKSKNKSAGSNAGRFIACTDVGTRVPFAGLFKSMPSLQDFALGPGSRDNLQPDRQAALCKPARKRERGQAGQIETGCKTRQAARLLDGVSAFDQRRGDWRARD